MTIRYLNKMYNIEYSKINSEEVEIWLQDPDDLDNYHYLNELPEHMQDSLHSLVDSLLNEPEEKMGYLD